MTIVISQFKEGKILLRTTQGLQDWYNILQAASYESKKRRKFWVTGQGAVEQWLLEKQENLLTTPAMKPDNDVNNNNLINNSSSNNINLNKNKAKESSTTTNINPPRGINRLSLVTDLLMGEVVSEFTSSRDPIQAGSRAPNPGVPRTQGGSRTHIEPVVVPKGGSRDPVVGPRIGVMRSNTRVPYRGEIDPSRGANYLDEPSERIRGAPEHEVSRGNFVRGEQDSGVDSGHSVNTSCDSQSENNSGEEDRVLRAADKLERVRVENMKKYDTPDLIKSSDSLIKRLDSFSISTQRLGVQGGRRGRILDCVTPV
ncbi:uncharacterized protein LOC111718007 [Eurytemora carolleeae]|uniref:uncharacterized protein LOC111718007 n=1 Tax=Eurytemora carolleeae TaxID=1294199 RepID=UPI000C783664|nr:uncharacterized protein LOC111718007 [Eurytemora carolleeae]|eukprot:XP_023349244.1 uncharacterized protein LOC111718007 [Eurytemora affinis]